MHYVQNAAVKGHTEVVEHLLARYVDFARDNDGTREDVIELIDRADNRGRTALWDACRFGHLDVVRALLGAGADPTRQNDEGLDALAISKSVSRKDSKRCMPVRTFLDPHFLTYHADLMSRHRKKCSAAMVPRLRWAGMSI